MVFQLWKTKFKKSEEFKVSIHFYQSKMFVLSKFLSCKIPKCINKMSLFGMEAIKLISFCWLRILYLKNSKDIHLNQRKFINHLIFLSFDNFSKRFLMCFGVLFFLFSRFSSFTAFLRSLNGKKKVEQKDRSLKEIYINIFLLFCY